MGQAIPNPADILVVDDSEIMRNMISGILQNGETPVATAASGKDALAMMANRKFKVVVADKDMPGISGIELTQAIRARDKKTVIIGISANNAPWVDAAFKKAGANRFIAKEEADLLPEIIIAELAFAA